MRCRIEPGRSSTAPAMRCKMCVASASRVTLRWQEMFAARPVPVVLCYTKRNTLGHTKRRGNPMVSHSENDLYIYMVYINYWRTEFIQDIQGWLQTHSKTNSKICIHILYRRMFSDTPILWSQWFHVSSPPSRLDGTALRGLQERAAGHGVSRQSTAGSVAGLVEPRQIDTTKQKKTWKKPVICGMDSDPKSSQIAFPLLSISISISISKNIQISIIQSEKFDGEPRAEHVNFLTTWDPKSALDSKAFRLASVSDPWLIFGSWPGGVPWVVPLSYQAIGTFKI